MTVTIISQSNSTKVWDWAGIEFAIPGSAVDSLSTALLDPVHKIVNIFLSISLNICLGCSNEPSL